MLSGLVESRFRYITANALRSKHQANRSSARGAPNLRRENPRTCQIRSRTRSSWYAWLLFIHIIALSMTLIRVGKNFPVILK